MQRYLLSTITTLVAAISIAYAIPARPLYVPPEPPRAPTPAPVVSVYLGGSAWLGKLNAINRLFVFEADGTVSYRTPASKANPIKGRGSWRVEGNTLIFDHFITKGNTILEFRGTIKDSNTIVGESTSKTGGKTMQTLQRTTLDK